MAAVPRRLGLTREIPAPAMLPDGFYDRLVQEMQSRRPEVMIVRDHIFPDGIRYRGFPYIIKTQNGRNVLGSIMLIITHINILIEGDNENLLTDVTSAVEAALAQGGGRRRSRKGRKTRARKGNRKHKTRGRK